MRRPLDRNYGRNNGHRREQLRARVLAEETHCVLCGRRVDTALGPGLPPSPEVDHLTPIARGGAPYDRANTALIHRACNQWKGKRTINEARAILAQVTGQATVTTNDAASLDSKQAAPMRTAPIEHSNTW